MTIDTDVSNLILSFRAGGLNDKGELVHTALQFTANAHREQRRKYTGEPYIAHPIELTTLVDHVAERQVASRRERSANARTRERRLTRYSSALMRGTSPHNNAKTSADLI